MHLQNRACRRDAGWTCCVAFSQYEGDAASAKGRLPSHRNGTTLEGAHGCARWQSKGTLNEWQLTNQVSLYRQNVLPRARSHARSCEDYRHGAGGRSTVPAVRPQRVNASAREESALYVSFWQIQNNSSLYTNLFAHHVQRHVRRAVGNESDALRDCQPPARRPVLIPRERLSCGSTRFVGVPPAALT